METTYFIGAKKKKKKRLEVCFLGKKPSALINTSKWSLINDTSPGLLHKGFLLNFSQKWRRLMMLSLVQKAPPLETLWDGEHTHLITAVRLCRRRGGYHQGVSRRNSIVNAVNLPHRLDDPNIYLLHFLPALLCKKWSLFFPFAREGWRTDIF